MTTNNTDNTKRTAAQRIEDLEKATMESYRVLDSIVRDLQKMKDAFKLLVNKTDAMAKASGQTEEQLSALMIENNVKELEGKVASLVSQGILTEEEQAGPNSFIVAREIDKEGKVANPRLQFVLSQIPKDVGDKILGAKSGDILDLGNDKLKLEVTETYAINNPADTAEAQAVAAPTEAPAEASAPAQEAPSEPQAASV